MRTLKVIRIDGLVAYAEGCARQQAEAAGLADGSPGPLAKLLLLQHAPVYTLGRMTRPEHLTTARALLEASGAEVIESDRGGSVTYHGPGQLTAYLLLNLKAWDLSIHRHLWNLEAAVIRALEAWGLAGRRVEGMTGVWCPQGPGAPEAKVCAIGVGCRRWVTYHGIGLNVDLDLAPFERIDPCGLGRKPVTSLARLLGRAVTLREAGDAIARAVGEVLEAERTEHEESCAKTPGIVE